MPKKDYYKRHKLEMKEYQRIRKQMRSGYIAELKVSSGCNNCGFDADSNKLHLHHRDPSTKLFGIAFGYRYKWEAYVEEVAKCDVLCVKCHAEIHSLMRQEEKGGARHEGRHRRSRTHGGSSVIGGVNR